MSAGNVFRSRIHMYYGVLLVLPLSYVLRIFLDTIIRKGLVVPLIVIFLMFVIFVIMARTKYTFTENGLEIKWIFGKKEIPYASVISAENTTDPMGLVSVTITYAASSQKTEREHITPARKEEFVARLSEKLPDLASKIKKLTIEDRTYAERDIYGTEISRAYRYGAVMLLCITLLFLSGALLFRSDHDISTTLIMVSAVFFFLDLVIVLIIILARKKIRYTFTENGLLIETIFRSAKIIIYYDDITSVTGTWDPSVSYFNLYGLSTGMIEITHNSGNASVFISPEKKEEFLTKLSSMLPDPKVIVRSGGKAA